jgi:hypothetical protein
MNSLPPPQSQSTSGIRTRSKGKARELPTGTPDAPHAQRGTKRPAVEDSPSPESPDPELTAPMAVDDEVTPRKPNAPRLRTCRSCWWMKAPLVLLAVLVLRAAEQLRRVRYVCNVMQLLHMLIPHSGNVWAMLPVGEAQVQVQGQR